jgi:large subunit ribosomal protein L23
MRSVKLAKERMYQVLRSPVVTEKSTFNSEFNQVTFLVDRSATKLEIASAVEGLFGVKVERVNTLRREGKRKRFRGFLGQRAETKKAMVTLAKGDSIDVTSGV